MSFEIDEFDETQYLFPRKLLATWTMDAQQDLRAMINSQQAAELTRILTRELAREFEVSLREDDVLVNWCLEGF